MRLERQLIKRYLMSYLLCVFFTLCGEQLISIFSLPWRQHLFLAAPITLAWVGVWISTSGLERALAHMGWSSSRALIPIGLCALLTSGLISTHELWMKPPHEQTLTLSLDHQAQVELCVRRDFAQPQCTSAPWRSAERLSNALSSQNNLNVERPLHVERSSSPMYPSPKRVISNMPNTHSFTARDTHAALIVTALFRLSWLSIVLIWLSLSVVPRVSLFVLTTLSIAIEYALSAI